MKNITSTVTYQGNLRTEACHVRSGQKIITDAPIDNNGKGEAFSPTDLCATSLVSCMMTIIGIAAQQHNIQLGSMKAEIIKEMSAAPRSIAAVRVQLFIENNSFTSQQVKLIEKAAGACPVGRSLGANVIQDVTIIWE